MKDSESTFIIIVLVCGIVLLTGILDATRRLNEKNAVDCLFEQAREQREQDWSLEDLYNPTGVWCFPEEYTVVPVDCQWYSKYAN